MIYVERRPLPDDVQAFLAAESKKLLEEISGSSELPQFKSSVWNRVKPAAMELFHGKCAFCETPLTASGEVAHLRPKQTAMNLDKYQDPLYYAWLAYEWDNIYPACYLCNRNKRSQFPVEGSRADVGMKGAELKRAEKTLLLDPCDSEDPPEKHLVFDASTGLVGAQTRKGETTIQIFGLNRDSLVYARKYEATAARNEILLALAGKAEAIQALLVPSRPHAAIRRAVISQHLQAGAKLTAAVEAILKATPASPVAPITSKCGPASVTAAKAETGYIESIVIENFRGVSSLTLPFAKDRTGWLILLGENAVGKSSVLQAVALALLGQKHLDRIPGPDSRWDDLLRNKTDEGRITLQLTAEPYKIDVRLRRGQKPKFAKKGAGGCPSLVLAYGPVRLAGTGAIPPKATDDRHIAEHRVANLFDSRMPLTPPEAWLLGLDPEVFGFVQETLRTLLHLPKSASFRVEDGRVLLDQANRPPVRLHQLSAGFGAMIALAADIMQAAPDVMKVKSEVSGIVVLDEVDAHLHPRWKMEVVRSLRTAFPNLQFIACTHEPLCLRGLRDDEVAVLVNDTGTVQSLPKLPSISTMRIDQLLTSRFFGLHSTMDPELDEQFRRYYQLLSTPPSERTDREQREVEKLAGVVNRHGVLGYTRRDRLVYECIDEYLAQEAKLPVKNAEKLREKTKTDVLRLWDAADAWLERKR